MTALTFHLSVAISRPPEVVFALLADIQNAEPIPRSATVQVIKDPTGPTTVGTQWHEAVKLAPWYWLRVENVVTQLRPPNLMTLAFHSSWFRGRLTYQIETVSNRSCVLHQHEILQPRPGLRWLSRFIERRLRPRLSQRLLDIKHILEDSDAGWCAAPS